MASATAAASGLRSVRGKPRLFSCTGWRVSHMQVWRVRRPGPSGEAHSVLVVGSGGVVAGPISFFRRLRLRPPPLMVQRQ
ncbi:hypothetical protein GCM10010273_09820 [Streptomyces lavendulocolor]